MSAQKRDQPTERADAPVCNVCGYPDHTTHEAVDIDLYLGRSAGMKVEDTQKNVTVAAPNVETAGHLGVLITREDALTHQHSPVQYHFLAQARVNKLPAEWFEPGDIVVVERLS
jgi:hypothetical protein